MNLFMLSGQQSVVLYVDGLKIGTITKLSSATGNINVFLYFPDNTHKIMIGDKSLNATMHAVLSSDIKRLWTLSLGILLTLLTSFFYVTASFYFAFFVDHCLVQW